MDFDHNGQVTRDEWLQRSLSAEQRFFEVQDKTGDQAPDQPTQEVLKRAGLSVASADCPTDTEQVAEQQLVEEDSAHVVEVVVTLPSPCKEPCPACGGADWLPHDDDCPVGVQNTVQEVIQSLRAYYKKRALALATERSNQLTLAGISISKRFETFIKET